MKPVLAERGYTIIEMTVALGIAALISILISAIYKNVILSSQQRQLHTTRDQVALWIRQHSGNLKNLKNSLKQPGNEQFYNCICGQGAGCASAKIYPFTLYDLSEAPLTPVPTYYDSHGFPCDKNATNCHIEVNLSFIAQCKPIMPSADPSPPATCTGEAVEFFGVLYSIRQNPLTLAQGDLFKTIAGTAFTQTKDLNPAGSGVCP